MSDRVSYLVGIRLDPDTSDADWYTVWFEDDFGQNRVVMRDGRVLWASDPDAARDLGASVLGQGIAVDAREVSVCDVAGALYAIAEDKPGNEGVVLMCLNLLDDIVRGLDYGPPVPNGEILDQLVTQLTRGEALRPAVETAGGKRAVIEPILSSLGRVFTWSTFGARER